MRFIYVCDKCKSYIGEIVLYDWDESMLGFDALNLDEKNDLISFDWEQRIVTVKSICDSCYGDNVLPLLLDNDIAERSKFH